MSLSPIKSGHFQGVLLSWAQGEWAGERAVKSHLSVCESAAGLVGLEPCRCSKLTFQVQVLKDGVLCVEDKPFTPEGEALHIIDRSSRGQGERRVVEWCWVLWQDCLSLSYWLWYVFFPPLAWCEGAVLLVFRFCPRGDCFIRCYRFGCL